jgi:hypothetical protein
MLSLFTITTSKDHHAAMNCPLSPPFVVNFVASYIHLGIGTPNQNSFEG